MTETALTKMKDRPSNGVMKKLTILGLCALCLAQTACVNVTAPDKPIVINLNISVTQEVVYRLDGQAKNLIQSQPGIF
ncbi:MAG: YnbE family lipoprotein [Pseudomonadota bacterium]|jgi:hypothetical protein